MLTRGAEQRSLWKPPLFVELREAPSLSARVDDSHGSFVKAQQVPVVGELLDLVPQTRETLLPTRAMRHVSKACEVVPAHRSRKARRKEMLGSKPLHAYACDPLGVQSVEFFGDEPNSLQRLHASGTLDHAVQRVSLDSAYRMLALGPERPHESLSLAVIGD